MTAMSQAARPLRARFGRALICSAAILAALLVPSAAQSVQARGQDASTMRAASHADAARIVTAILTPRHQAILSAEVSARVAAVKKELGERFEADEVLVQLEDLTYRVNLQIAQAELAGAQQDLVQARKLTEANTRQRHADAVLAAAKANLNATQRLHDDGHASLVDLENARRDVQTAQAECELVSASAAKELSKAERDVAVAQARCDLAQGELRGCTLKAPYAGRVARVLINENELVERGTPAIEIVDDRVLRAKFLLPSTLFRGVRLGQELHLDVRETGATVVVRISHIAAVLDAASETFEVYAELDNAAGELRAGMNGTLQLSELRTP